MTFVEPVLDVPELELVRLGEASDSGIPLSLVVWSPERGRQLAETPLPPLPPSRSFHQAVAGRAGPDRFVIAAGSVAWNGGGPVLLGVVNHRGAPTAPYRELANGGTTPTLASDGELVAVAWLEFQYGKDDLHVATVSRSGGLRGRHGYVHDEDEDEGPSRLDHRTLGLVVSRGSVFVALLRRDFIQLDKFDATMKRQQTREIERARSSEPWTEPMQALLSSNRDGLVLATGSQVHLLDHDLAMERTLSVPAALSAHQKPIETEVTRRSDGWMLSSSGHCGRPGDGFQSCLNLQDFQALEAGTGPECAYPAPRIQVRADRERLLFLAYCEGGGPYVGDEGPPRGPFRRQSQLVVLR